ncbi:MAG TPA: hypothetical protein VFC51_10700 [Chloroflexota bacterium]|nr:hypothetical protein [Chloroflexota bacterium]
MRSLEETTRSVKFDAQSSLRLPCAIDNDLRDDPREDDPKHSKQYQAQCLRVQAIRSSNSQRVRHPYRQRNKERLPTWEPEDKDDDGHVVDNVEVGRDSAIDANGRGYCDQVEQARDVPSANGAGELWNKDRQNDHIEREREGNHRIDFIAICQAESSYEGNSNTTGGGPHDAYVPFVMKSIVYDVWKRRDAI